MGVGWGCGMDGIVVFVVWMICWYIIFMNFFGNGMWKFGYIFVIMRVFFIFVIILWVVLRIVRIIFFFYYFFYFVFIDELLYFLYCIIVC